MSTTKKHAQQQDLPKNEVHEQDTPQGEAQSSSAQSGDDMAEMEKLKGELADAKDKYLRQAAEFDNYRKRTIKEKLDLAENGGIKVISALLEVLDDYDRASQQLETATDVKQLKVGVDLIFAKFKKILEAQGLKEMETLEKDFDVEMHEAITEIPAMSPELAGKVVDELQKGYFLNDRIIRHAKVVVGK